MLETGGLLVPGREALGRSFLTDLGVTVGSSVDGSLGSEMDSARRGDAESNCPLGGDVLGVLICVSTAITGGVRGTRADTE